VIAEAERLREAARIERQKWAGAPRRGALHLMRADLLDAEALHIEIFDCAAHCEPAGCDRSMKALAVAGAILGGES
jgi:hypothetical protein